jgi:hypothetical protein
MAYKNNRNLAKSDLWVSRFILLSCVFVLDDCGNILCAVDYPEIQIVFTMAFKRMEIIIELWAYVWTNYWSTYIFTLAQKNKNFLYDLNNFWRDMPGHIY